MRDIRPSHPAVDRPRCSRILGTLLVERALVTRSQLEDLLGIQRETGERLGEVAVRTGAVDAPSIAQALADQLGLTFVDAPLTPSAAAVALVKGAFARSRRLLPLATEPRRLDVAMADPLDLSAIDDLQFQSGRRVRPFVATPRAIEEGLEAAYGAEMEALASALPQAPPPDVPPEVHVDEGADQAPLVRLVDALLRRSIEAGASDLHIEHGRAEVIVRERVDGLLRPVTELPHSTRGALVSRLKVMAGMDISVRRRPQDGGFAVRLGGRTLRVRVSTLPVQGGEKAVLRVLDPRAAPRDLGSLGFSAGDLLRVRALLGSQGVVLATGPTGSGKSSTLFGALGEVDAERLNVVTLEDPVEYRVRGASQVQVEPRGGLTFPAALRSILRQDPDVIMVGEIRDRETAEIAMSAAITGHLVLSTLHTVDAPSAITRLLQMGVPAHLVAGGLTGVIAQRLVRRRCRRCDGSGCPGCRDGYQGRIGVFQVLLLGEALREAVAQGADTDRVRRIAEENGMGTLAGDARRKVELGITTGAEAARVLGEGVRGGVCPRCGEVLPSHAEGCPRCGVGLVRRCPCGRALRDRWRHCPTCLRKAPDFDLDPAPE